MFKDKKRTEVHFGVVEDVRSTIAHSRDLMSFERDLLSGMSGQLLAQVSRYSHDLHGSAIYYPHI